jgi:uncharacterized protein DUF6173
MAKDDQWDKRPAMRSKNERDPAEWMFERVATQIIEFQESLSPNEEVGVRLVTAPREGVFHIKDLDCWGPDMLIFHGEDEGGRPIRLLQHYSQLSVLLCAVPREKDTEPKIGFVLHRRLKEL